MPDRSSAGEAVPPGGTVMSPARICGIVAGTAIGLASAAPLAAQDASSPALPPGPKGEMLMWITDAEHKLIELSEATPEKKYSYRPSKDVRSTGEIFLHVAAANFGIPA